MMQEEGYSHDRTPTKTFVANLALPYVPPSPPPCKYASRSSVSEGVEEATLNFENVFTGGILTASYRRGAAVLCSDSASTLAIVKELVSKEATARRVNITDTFQVWENGECHYAVIVCDILAFKVWVLPALDILRASRDSRPSNMLSGCARGRGGS